MRTRHRIQGPESKDKIPEMEIKNQSSKTGFIQNQSQKEMNPKIMLISSMGISFFCAMKNSRVDQFCFFCHRFATKNTMIA